MYRNPQRLPRREPNAATGPVTERLRVTGRYIIWRNNHAYDERLRQVVTRANVA